MKVTIQIASRITGISADTIRIWERRYHAVTPERTERGVRVYSEADIRRLKLLADAVRRGERISQLVQRSDESLMALSTAPGADGEANEVGALLESQDQLKTRLRQQMQIARLGRYAAAGDLLQGLYRQAVLSVAQGLGVDYTAVFEVEDVPVATLALRAHYGWKTDAPVCTKLDETTLPGYAVLYNEPTIMSERSMEKRFDLIEELRSQPIRSAIAIPFGVYGRRGVITAHSTSPRIFDSADVEFLESLTQLLTHAAERAHSYNSLQAAHAALSDVFNGIEDPLFTVDLQGRILDANAPIISARGAEIIGQSIYDHGHYSQPENRARLESVVRTGKSLRYEFYSEECQTWYEATIHRISNGCAIQTHDIGLRKISEFALRGKSALYSMLLRSVPGALWTTDEDLTVLSVAGKLVRLLGLKKGEMLGKPLAHAFAEAGEDIVRAHREALLGKSVAADVVLRGHDVRLFIERSSPQEERGTIAFAVAID